MALYLQRATHRLTALRLRHRVVVMKFPLRFAFLLRMGFVLLLSLGLWARAAGHGSVKSAASHHAASHHVKHHAVHSTAARKVASRRRRPVRHARVGHTAIAHHARRRSHVRTVAATRTRRRRVRHVSVGQTWTARSYLAGLGAHDAAEGEDPQVRAAAVRALGNLNGTAVVVDPNNGRILAMVNQDLALSSQYQPCSTTKMAVSLAALHYGIVNENTPVLISAHHSVNMTQALAWSINPYFEELGRRLGFARVSQYEHMMGLGERAGWNIPGESPGVYPDHPGEGGVGKLCSFGEGIHITPLQLASIVMSIANGGTMYYLQHPLNQEQARDFVPRIKRHLDIAALTPEVKDGMLAAVQYGTARRAHLANVSILGKTGTCSRDGTRFGLFASYLGLDHPRMVVVVILRGNRSVFGPRAAEIAGDIYKALDQRRYFAVNHERRRTASLPAMALPVPGAN